MPLGEVPAMATNQPSYPGMPYQWFKNFTINPPSKQKPFTIPVPPVDPDIYQLSLPATDDLIAGSEPERPAGEVVIPVWDGKWPTPPEMTEEEQQRALMGGLNHYQFVRQWNKDGTISDVALSQINVTRKSLRLPHMAEQELLQIECFIF